MRTTLLLILLLMVLPLAGLAEQPDRKPDPGKALRTALAVEQALTALVARVRPAYVMIGGGSGVLISPDGYMLTNFHVAGQRKEWAVILPDGRRFKAVTTGSDNRGDLCLLKLQGPQAKDLPHVPLGDSDAVRHGQWVVAIGNPWMVGRMDAQPTVTLGIVSATHVFRGNYTDAIQTDAPINPGNSGGPLIDMGGRLIGINGQVAVRFGTDRINSGIGFAIPSNQIKNFLARMKAAGGGNVPHGVLAGVGIDPGYHGGTGARVLRVDPKSAAFRAGLRDGDRVVEVEGRRITGRHRLFGVLGIFPAGTLLRLKVARGDGTQTISVPLAARQSIGQPTVSRPDAPFLGIKIAQSFQGPGAEVESVTPGSAAEKADIRAGDILLTFEGTTLRDGAHLVGLIGRRKAGDKVKLTLKRGLDRMTVTAELGRRPQR